MFFPVSKVAWLLLEPLTLSIVVAGVGVGLLFTRYARVARRIAALGAAALIVLFLTPLGVALMRPLENRFPPPPANLPDPTGIIVLGGALSASLTEARGPSSLSGDGERLTEGLELARRYPQARLIFTGGSGALISGDASEAVGVRRFWEALGGPAERMSFEDSSRNTWENAVFTRNLLKPKPGEVWLLVTSAWHMPRSIGIFRRVGFDVVAYPVAYRTYGDWRDWSLLHTAFERAPLVYFAVREWIGLFVYWATGKTATLFPAP
ncbi:YdcF family protein [Methylocella sp.]|uniref:YdcF family protein n=1 Tax=Methylocella sp. TaxID=1978226 RepID=UPI0035AFBF1A